ncbi:unnamed protein product [Pleuronectes platessa]|uniref:Uncharacterized protein n=1 Tax=Pleuronectes platessa TaxID=8262 RepID=A0A9N7VY93_PLEPL|nr:unnamed protein product [Pleuronectes platessa]
MKCMERLQAAPLCTGLASPEKAPHRVQRLHVAQTVRLQSDIPSVEESETPAPTLSGKLLKSLGQIFDNVDRRVICYLRRWLGLPRILSSISLYGSTCKLNCQTCNAGAWLMHQLNPCAMGHIRERKRIAIYNNTEAAEKASRWLCRKIADPWERANLPGPSQLVPCSVLIPIRVERRLLQPTWSTANQSAHRITSEKVLVDSSYL